MSAKTGNAVLKLVLVLAVLAGGVVAVMFGLRPVATVDVVTRDVAVDAVPGSVEVVAEKGLQTLRIEGAGRVVDAKALDPGESFKQDDVLLTLDTTELDRIRDEKKREYDAAKAEFAAANTNNSAEAVAQKAVTDMERLFKAERASREDVAKAERELQAVQNKLAVEKLRREKLDADFEAFAAGHKIQEDKMKVVAPMAGMIEGAMVAPGTLVTSGTTVATFYPTERHVLAKVSEEDFAKIELGDPARVRLLSVPQREFDAKVSKILPFADPETRRFTVYLDLILNAEADKALLRPGSTGEVTITTDRHENVPLVPSGAITFGNVVYVVKDGRVERRQIEVGFRGLITAEVIKGLEPGEYVIVERIDQFRDGQRVKIELPKKR
jgi:RND family efflux transporter MFP subunit